MSKKVDDLLNAKINFSKYPNFWQLKNVFQKILWVLFVYKEENIKNSLTKEELFTIIKSKLKSSKIKRPAIKMAIQRAEDAIDFEEFDGKKRYYITKEGENRFLKKSKESELSASKVEEIEKFAGSIPNTEEREYFNEAMVCFRHETYRGAVVLGWIVCMWHIYQQIEKKGAKKFQKAAANRFPNSQKKKVKKREDLQYYTDSEIIILCEDLGIIDRNLRGELEKNLDLRNHCAHPGSYKIGKIKTIGFFEDIIQNVLLK